MFVWASIRSGHVVVTYWLTVANKPLQIDNNIFQLGHIKGVCRIRVPHRVNRFPLYIRFPHKYAIFGQLFIMCIEHLVIYIYIILDNKFELLGLHINNEFVLIIRNVVAKQSPPIWEFLYHMWDDRDLLHVHVGFHEQGDSGVIMFRVSFWQRVPPFMWWPIFTSSVFWRAGHILACLLTPNFPNWQVHKPLLACNSILSTTTNSSTIWNNMQSNQFHYLVFDDFNVHHLWYKISRDVLKHSHIEEFNLRLEYDGPSYFSTLEEQLVNQSH